MDTIRRTATELILRYRIPPATIAITGDRVLHQSRANVGDHVLALRSGQYMVGIMQPQSIVLYLFDQERLPSDSIIPFDCPAATNTRPPEEVRDIAFRKYSFQ